MSVPSKLNSNNCFRSEIVDKCTVQKTVELTPKKRFITALKLGKPDRVPTFELEFQLAPELLGKDFPDESGWKELSGKERDAKINRIAELYVEIAGRLEYSAIMLVHPRCDVESKLKAAEKVKELTGDKYFILIHIDGTYAIPDGDEYLDFSYKLFDDPAGMKAAAGRKVNQAIEVCRRAVDAGIDGVAECCDYCFNDGPFISPPMFREFITPYLARLIQSVKELGLYFIKHTDGNIMPIIDQLVECNPHALHSLDPMAGVDIKEIKHKWGDKVCLIGNVNCALLQTGTDAEIRESAGYAIINGKPGGGYIFSTSNVAFRGMKLEKYHIIQEVWKKHRDYQ